MQSINVLYNVIGKYVVSTAMWATGITATGMYHPTYETFVFEWDENKKERGKIIKQYYHSCKRVGAIQFHLRMCRTLAYRSLKEKLPSDLPFAEEHI